MEAMVATARRSKGSFNGFHDDKLWVRDKKGLKRSESKGVILGDAELKSKCQIHSLILPERFVVVKLAQMNSIVFFAFFLFEDIDFNRARSLPGISLTYGNSWSRSVEEKLLRTKADHVIWSKSTSWFDHSTPFGDCFDHGLEDVHQHSSLVSCQLCWIHCPITRTSLAALKEGFHLQIRSAFASAAGSSGRLLRLSLAPWGAGYGTRLWLGWGCRWCCPVAWTTSRNWIRVGPKGTRTFSSWLYFVFYN